MLIGHDRNDDQSEKNHRDRRGSRPIAIGEKLGPQGLPDHHGVRTAEQIWNHELADTSRTVSASLTSIAAPAYFLPAVDLGHDWGSGTIGTRFRLGPSVSGYAAFTGQFGQGNVVTYGGQIGLNVALN